MMKSNISVLGKLLDGYKNIMNTNFDKSKLTLEIKKTVSEIMSEQQIISYTGFESVMRNNNIDIKLLNNISGILSLDNLRDWGPNNSYFTQESLQSITNTVQEKVSLNINNNDMLKIKTKRFNSCKNGKFGKITSNIQKYIKWKNNNENGNNIMSNLEDKIQRYKNNFNISKDIKDKKNYEKYRKELQRTKKKINEYNNIDNKTNLKKIHTYPFNQTNKISSRNSTKSFLMNNIYKNTSKNFSKKHDFYNRSIAKTDLKLVYNDIYTKIVKANIINDDRKKLFNYLMNHFLKYFNMHFYGNQTEIQDILNSNIKDKEKTRNRTITSFYNNLNSFIEELLSKNQNYGRLETNPVMRSLIVGMDTYKVCYLQFLNLMVMESNLAFSKLDNNTRLNKVRNDYYNNSFFLSALKRKELLNTFYNKNKLNDNDKIYLQKTINTFSPFRLQNNNSIALLPSNDFPTCVTNITNSNIMLQVVNTMSKDNRNISPVDIFYMYGIPIKDISDETKRKIGFNKKEAANSLRELYSYQVAMIDSLRINRIKKLSKDVTKKFSIYEQISKDSLKNVYISHPLNTKQGFLLPLPLEFIDGKISNVFSIKIIKSYIRLFNLPRPGFIGDPDIGFEHYNIDDYLLYLKTKGFGSYLTHYIVNFLDEIKTHSSNFAFLKIIFNAEMENGTSKFFTITFPISFSNLNNFTRSTEEEIYNRIRIELQLQLEFYDEEQGIFELYIVDISFEFMTSNINNQFGLSAFHSKKKKYKIKPIFESSFPDLHLCLFECFFFLYHCLLFNLIPSNTTTENIQKLLNVVNWIDYKSYLVNFFFCIDVIPELKETCIKGDVRGLINILSSNYSLNLGVFNTFDETYYPDDLFIDNNINEVLIWSNFHVYLTSKIYLDKYLKKKLQQKVAVYKMEVNKKLIKKHEFKDLILALDIETLTNTDNLNFGNQKPYLIQIWGGTDEFDFTFWGVDNCVSAFVEWFPTLFEVDKEIFIFAHNGAQFDYKFLMSELMNRYSVEITGDHNKIILFKIRNVSFLDFFLFFPTSLNNLSKSWIGEEKLEFDHNKINLDNYNTEYKQLAIEYCKKDCILLFKIVNKFLCTIFETSFKNNINLSGVLNFYTAPQLALRIFKSIYLQCELEGSIGWNYLIEKESYYGGMCVVYRKQGLENLYCYDVNSCYPASMLCLMPFKLINEIDNLDDNINFIDYYLYQIDYRYKENQIIVNLPTRLDDEIIYVRNGIKKWHWGAEIKTAILLGCEVLKIHKIREYEGKYIFKDYIEDIYAMRLKAKEDNNKCLIDFFKLLMNSLYGKLGQKLNLQKNIVSIAELNEVVMYYNDDKIKNIKMLDGNCVEYEYEDLKEYYNQIGSLVRFSSYITARARCILLSPFADGVLNHENLFYTDTDSIFINKKLPKNYVSDTILGKFKLEYEINKAFFLAPKMYIVESNNEIKMKMKGIPKKHLKEEYFYKILNEGCQKINYTSFIRYFSEIYVGEITKRIVLKSYKRFYFENGNSVCWNTINEFNDNKMKIMKALKDFYPTIKIDKTDRKIKQSEIRKTNNINGIKIEMMIKNNYIMTYDDFFEYYQNDESKKDIYKTWDSLNNMNEPEKYYTFLTKTFPLFMISRGKKKSFASDEMVKEITLYLLNGEYTKKEYYGRISNFLISCKKLKKHVVDLKKIKSSATKSEILEYYNRIKQEHPEYSDYACMKKTLFTFCNTLIKGEDFKGKFKHVSPYYLDLMNFYFKYLLDNSI